MKCDTLIVGSGVAGLYTALSLPQYMDIILISKDRLENSDSFLAQGGICYWKSDDDFDSFFMDTLRAGHFENDPLAVKIMIEDSRKVIADLEKIGVSFHKKDGSFVFTREGAHSTNRILYQADETGREITSKLLAEVRTRKNIRLMEYTVMTDILIREGECIGITADTKTEKSVQILSGNVMLACGGIGGLYRHSTNFPHLTGDSMKIARKHGIRLKNMDYVQIHPTTLYSEKSGRRFLISESVRGEGAHILNSKGERFVNELLPRDVVTQAIEKEMKREGSKHVWIDMRMLGEVIIKTRFPNIYQKCMEEGVDPSKDLVPVVPAQHYFMGGIDVDLNSATSMPHLYAAGENSCNGVHGANRLASNSLLESMVFAGRAAADITRQQKKQDTEKILVQKTEKFEFGFPGMAVPKA